MEIIAHRGFWLKKKEENSLIAFKRALDSGFGIELDVRDYRRKIAIAHDVTDNRKEKLERVLEALSGQQNFKRVTFAINIKSDGIENEIARLITAFGIKKNSFVFDMSATSTYLFYKKFAKKILFATRHSDIERNPLLYRRANWVWLDELEKSWINNAAILFHLKNRKRVCIVSSELHQRSHLESWHRYKLLPDFALKKVCLCTDRPESAARFFNERLKR